MMTVRASATRKNLMFRWFWRLLSITAVLLGTLCIVVLGNRESVAARIMVTAPNQGRAFAPPSAAELAALHASGVDTELRIPVGDPPATLAVWVVNPPGASGSHHDRGDVRGTILYLHGIYNRKESLMPAARAHAARGYRGILVDLRGHGHSTGDWISFGAREVDDLRQLIDALDRRGLIAGKLGVYGCSYGAGVGAQLAGREPRVQAAVLLAPFCSWRAVAHSRTRSLGLSWAFNDAQIDSVLGLAGNLCAVCPDDADGGAALQARHVPLLVLHGSRDDVIPCEQGAAICAAAGPDSRFELIAGASHDHWTDAGLRQIRDESSAWFDRWLAP